MASVSWIPATLDNINRTTLTFHAGGELHVRAFATPFDALDAVHRSGAAFDFSPERNQLRSHDDGQLVSLPAESAGGVPTDHTYC